MAKLTKKQSNLHNQALVLLSKENLSLEDKDFIFENWNEGANHINGEAGAFFTPLNLAFDFAIDVSKEGRIIDLCAGIGILSYAVLGRNWHDKENLEIVCIESNPDYVEVGKKLVPEATWICADVMDVLDMNLGHFDNAISNPPFGNISRSKDAPRYQGKDFEYHVIDIASKLADFGTFILPQMSAGFNYSGRPYYERQKEGKAVKFQNLTGLYFEAGCGVDTNIYLDQWKGVSPMCEIVCVEFNNGKTSILSWKF